LSNIRTLVAIQQIKNLRYRIFQYML